MLDVGTEDGAKSNTSPSVHEMTESRPPRKDLPQTLVRSMPYKRMSFSVFTSAQFDVKMPSTFS